jgi:glycosyltransferase involved in cell wall biosynthesis
MASLDGGGIQTATVRLAGEFLRRGYPTSLIVLNARGPVRADLPKGCELIDLDCRRIRQALRPLVAHLRKRQARILISAQTHINSLAILARLLTGYPRCLIVAEHIALEESVKHSRSLRDRIRPLMIRLLYPHASHVVAVSADAVRGLRKLAGLKGEIHVIHNGLDLERIGTLASEGPSHPWLQQPGLKVVLGMGRLAPQKNFALLLRAFARVPDADARLIILGEGPERERLLALARELSIENRIGLPGFAANPFPFLRQCSVFALSSRWEGFANVVIEALACGAAIVATDCPGGPAEILECGRFGQVVAPEDEVAMAAAISRMLRSSPDRAALQQHAATFSIEKTARQYVQLLNGAA